MRIILGVFLFLLLPSLGWADGQLWTTPGPDDKSVQYLGFVFGVVNGLLHGSGSQIMGQMFAKFNSGILVLAGFVVFYTTILGLLSSAQEGEFLGKKYSSFFVPLRTALGIILIAPTTTGYSWIQVVVMWMVLQGVGAANMVWQAAVGYLDNGGAVIVQNQDQQGGIFSSGYAVKIRSSMSNMMSSVSCMQLMQHAIDQSTLSQHVRVTAPSVTAVESVTNEIALVSGATDPSQLASKSGTAADGNIIVTVPMPDFPQTTDTDKSWATALNGKCGSVAFEVPDGVAMSQVISDLAAAAPAVTDTCNAGCFVHGNQATIPNLPAIDPSYCDSNTYLYNGAVNCSQNMPCTLFGFSGGTATTLPSGVDSRLSGIYTDAQTHGTPLFSWCSNVDMTQPSLNTTFNNAVMDFIGLTFHNSNKDSTNSSKISSAVGSSWFSAGTFYFALVAQNEGAQNTESHSTFTVNFPTGSPATTLVIPPFSFDKPLDQVSPIFNTWLMPFFISAQGNNNLVGNFIKGQVGAQNYGHTPVSDSITDVSSAGGIEGMIINALLPGIVEMINSFVAMTDDQSSNANPVVLMMMFGSGMLNMAMTIWFGVSILIGAVTLLLGAVPCVNLAESMEPITQVISPFLNMLLIPMFVSGCMLLFYLPAVPFMIFTFGAIGWIIGVIEAMVAAPVVGFAIMSPEGNDIFGKGDPAIMIMLNVFLRPSLMIFGLIAGIMVSYIGIWMVNDGYSSILSTIAFAGGNFASLLIGLLAVPMVYMIICMQVINRSFTLIHVLPDKVTRWLSGGQSEQLGSEMAGAEKDARSAAQGGMKSVGKGMEKAGAGFKQGRKDRAAAAQKDSGDEVQSGSSDAAPSGEDAGSSVSPGQ